AWRDASFLACRASAFHAAAGVRGNRTAPNCARPRTIRNGRAAAHQPGHGAPALYPDTGHVPDLLSVSAVPLGEHLSRVIPGMGKRGLGGFHRLYGYGARWAGGAALPDLGYGNGLSPARRQVPPDHPGAVRARYDLGRLALADPGPDRLWPGPGRVC